MPDIFERATKKKLRFATPTGNLSVEDLWDLPLETPSTSSRRALQTSLNEIAVGLYTELKNAPMVSFVSDKQPENADVQLRFDIVKHIIEVRKAQQQQAEAAASKREQKAKIMEILSKKKDQDLENKSAEELEALLANL